MKTFLTFLFLLFMLALLLETIIVVTAKNVSHVDNSISSSVSNSENESSNNNSKIGVTDPSNNVTQAATQLQIQMIT
jgi:hypothetical protein